MIKKTFVLLSLCLVAHAGFAQTWQDTIVMIDRVFDQYHAGSPGCQFAISRNGKIIYSKAWGMADLERGVSLTTTSVTEAGSVSKQFTAAAILLLQQRGKLSLDDNIRKYIPEMPDYGIPITLREMMHHTSGLRDWGAVAALTGWPRTQKFYTNKDVLQIIVHQKHLSNKPGTEFLYSNSNYNLFAIVVQRVSGLTLADFTKKYIFEPAGMTHTQWRDDPNRVVPNRAIAYSISENFKQDSTYKIDMPNEYAYGNGGLLTTAEDLLKWNDFYLSGKLGSPSLLPEQIKTERLTNGGQNHYAAGLNIEDIQGWQNINHSGITASYQAYLEAFPQLGLSFAITNNSSQFSIVAPVAKVRRILVPGKSEKRPQINDMILTDAVLDEYAGLYIGELDGNIVRVTGKNGHLETDNGTMLNPVAAGVFKNGSKTFFFDRHGESSVSASGDTVRFMKVQAWHPALKELQACTGDYQSDETSSTMTMAIENNQLVMKLGEDVTYKLSPTYADAFEADKDGINLKFSRDGNGKISEIKINVERARGIIYEKQLLK